MKWPSETTCDVIVVILLILATLSIRVPIAAERQIMPAGDAFNYQHITSHILRFDYPHQEKRLPFYPILLIPSRFTAMDFIDASVATSVLMGALTVGALYLLGRQLQLHRVALLLLLGLSIFDPLLTVNSVRPFGDSTFVFTVILFLFLVTRILRASSPPPPSALLGLGVAATCMMFTRYEGFLIAALVYPLLWFRLPWKNIAVAAAIPFAISLAWIPAYLHIHGSLLGLSYLSDASGTGFGEVSGITGNLIRMLNGSRFLGVFSLPAHELTEDSPAETVQRIVTEPSWWFSLFALLGAVWIVIRNRWAGLAILLAGTGYAFLLSWWWVYSRYVAPLSALFYLLAAAGLSSLLTAIDRRGKWLPTIAVIIVLLAVSAGVFTESKTSLRTALNNAWENNNKGLALFSAMKFAAQTKESTLYWSDEHAFATLYLGYADKPHTFTNAAQGVYASRLASLSLEELYDYLSDHHVRNFIYAQEKYDDRLEPLRNLLQQRGRIEKTILYSSSDLATGTVETTPVYQLDWQ